MDKTAMAKNVFGKQAVAYQQKFMNVDIYKQPLDIFCNNIHKEDAALLDAACGPGNITRYLLDVNPHFKITGIDIAPKMLSLASSNNPTATFSPMDIRDIAKLSYTFEGVLVGFGLPYLSKQEAISLINNIATILTKNGVLYISTMEGNYEESGLQKSSQGDELYIYYHEADYLLEALEQTGFNLLHIQRIQYPGKNNMKVTDLVLVAVCK